MNPGKFYRVSEIAWWDDYDPRVFIVECVDIEVIDMDLYFNCVILDENRSVKFRSGSWHIREISKLEAVLE